MTDEETPPLSRPGTRVPGIGIDAFGGQVIDPTKNVLDLVRAEAKWRDRLFELEAKWRDQLDRIRAEHVKELQACHTDCTTRVNAIETEFSEKSEQLLRERIMEGDTNREKNVNSALLAAKEAVGKAEIATGKQIEQLGTLITTAVAGLEGKIGDVKERMTRIESAGQGVKAAHDDSRANLALIVSAVSVVVLLLVSILPLLLNTSRPPTPTVVSTPSAPTQQLEIPRGYVLVPATPPQPATR